MDSKSLDHYEQQLLKVFDSHDYEKRGSLDLEGLHKLCQTLQLDDQSSELTRGLLTERKLNRVTFNDFRDALLNLLDKQHAYKNYDVDASPEREVSPKFVYGSKKYGRRSRPRDEIAKELVDFRSASDVKKRKPNKLREELKCFKGEGDFGDVCTEQMLREAWKKLGVGEDGSLNQAELMVVCDAIGLNRLADSVIHQLSNQILDFDQKISFQQLLEVLQRDETWIGFMGNDYKEREDFKENFNSKYSQHIDDSGFIDSDVIVDLWESAGILSPKLLLQDLGFKETRINVKELSAVVEKELKGMNGITHGISDLRIDHIISPHVALLNAFLALYQMEIKCMRGLLDQMQIERDKLKCDVYEANNRSDLISQEIDETVAKLEHQTKKQTRLLEQRHADLLKQMTEQCTSDKEQMSVLNQNLEDKIRSLEGEELKLRGELVNAQKDIKLIENENSELNQRIDELETTNVSLKKKLEQVEEEKTKAKEYDLEERNKLLERLTDLQVENCSLRDKYDEMLSRIEAISLRNSTYDEIEAVRNNYTAETSDGYGSENCESLVSVGYEQIGVGNKRRSKLDSKDDDVELLGNESPRLGKVRKFEAISIAEDFLTSTPTLNNDEDEGVLKLRNRIADLESRLIRRSEQKCENEDEKEVQLKKNYAVRCEMLESTVTAVNASLKRLAALNFERDDGDSGNGSIVSLREKLDGVLLENDVGNLSLSDNLITYRKSMEEIARTEDAIKSKLLERRELTLKCEEMEVGMGLLRNEYEKTEDYWAGKLDEERGFFEQEQEISNTKLTEVIAKLNEYEEQFVRENRLATIDETETLEKQFNDLEKEFEDYRDEQAKVLEEEREKSTELQAKLDVLSREKEQLAARLFSESACQTIDIQETQLVPKTQNLTSDVIEITDLYAAEIGPESLSSDGLVTLSESNSRSFDSATPYRRRRTKIQKRAGADAVNGQRWNGMGDLSEIDEPKCLVKTEFLNELQAKKYSLEQRCKKLQSALKQQQHYDEQMIQLTWQQRITEKAELQSYIRYYKEKHDALVKTCNELQDRLARNDILVKDLFVDNSYLTAQKQRLEQRCHVLTQYTPNHSI